MPQDHRRRWPASSPLAAEGLCPADDAPGPRPADRHRDAVAIPCGSTRESVCPPCADKARVLRMQQCAEGWHRDHEPDHHDRPTTRTAQRRRGPGRGRQLDDRDRSMVGGCGRPGAGRMCRTCRGCRWRTGRSAGCSPPRTAGVPAVDVPHPHPAVLRAGHRLRAHRGIRGRYDYRRAALDALHFPKLVDRLWQNLRRCAGYKVQYFAAIEPQKRLAPHLHAAIRGAIPREMLRQVSRPPTCSCGGRPSTSPSTSTGCPVWTGTDYVDPTPGRCCRPGSRRWTGSTRDPDARPAHVLRFGSQLDMAGIIAPSADADRAVRYLTKYLTKSIADTYTDPDTSTRLARRTSTGCTTSCAGCRARRGCANWLRYGIQPNNPGPGLDPRLVRSTRRTTGRTSASAAAASWSPGSGPAKPSPSTGPTGPPSSARRC